MLLVAARRRRPGAGPGRHACTSYEPDQGWAAQPAHAARTREWSVYECIAHIADAELVVGGRYRWILAQDRPELLPYDQDLWVDRLHAGDEDPADLLATFEALRRRTSTYGAGRPYRSARATVSTASAVLRVTS
jgi:hypothetical protein